MKTIKVEFKPCPYCGRDIEVEVKGSDLQLQIRQEIDSIMPESILKDRQMIRDLEDQGIDLMQIRDFMEKETTVEEIEEHFKITRNFAKMAVLFLKRQGEIFEPRQGVLMRI